MGVQDDEAEAWNSIHMTDQSSNCKAKGVNNRNTLSAASTAATASDPSATASSPTITPPPTFNNSITAENNHDDSVTHAAAASKTTLPEQNYTSAMAITPIRIVSRVVRGFGRGSTDLGIPTANVNCDENVITICTTSSSTISESSCASTTASKFSTTTTTTIPIENTKTFTTLEELPTGIYWGFCRIGNEERDEEHSDSSGAFIPSGKKKNRNSALGVTFPTAVSIGYNPTYGNATKTIEPHLIAPASDPRRHASSCQETQLTLTDDFYDQIIRLSVVGYLRPELPFAGLEPLVAAIKNDIRQTEQLVAASLLPDRDIRIATEREWVTSSQGFDLTNDK